MMYPVVAFLASAFGFMTGFLWAVWLGSRPKNRPVHPFTAYRQAREKELRDMLFKIDTGLTEAEDVRKNTQEQIDKWTAMPLAGFASQDEADTYMAEAGPILAQANELLQRTDELEAQLWSQRRVVERDLAALEIRAGDRGPGGW